MDDWRISMYEPAQPVSYRNVMPPSLLIIHRPCIHQNSGVAILLFLVGFIPFSHLLFLLLSLLCILACLRTLALTALVQRLQYLQQQDGVGGSPATEEGSPRTAPSTRVLLFDTISASLLNLRLSLIDRDFTAADYEALLGLDATRTRVPVTDAQLASLHHFKYSTYALWCMRRDAVLC